MVKKFKRIHIGRHYWRYNLQTHEITGRWKPSGRYVWRFALGFNDISIHGEYYSITYVAFARKKSDLPNETEGLEKIDDYMKRNVHSDWKSWVEGTWHKTGLSVEMVGYRRDLPEPSIDWVKMK